MFQSFESIQIGDSQAIEKTITADDVRKFVDMTGDDNPLHVDRRYAEATAFKDIVVHGMLGASFISTVIGTRLPGTGALWVSQNIEFLLPVRLGDVLSIRCTVLRKHERERLLELETDITNQHGKRVLSGQGKVKVLASKQEEALPAAQNRQQVAIVTGGAGGIGRAICLRLAEAGFNVVVNYRGRADRATEVVDAIQQQGKGQAIAFQADIATPQGAQALYQATVHRFGPASVLINNASPAINPKPFEATSWEDIQTHLDVQAKGAFLLAQLAVPAMVQQHWGRIINITSQVLDGTPSATWTGYAMGKSALATLARYLAVELGPSGITVNCVSPGMCETGLIGDISEKTQLMIARQTPRRRLARPADVAAAVAYLVSEEADFVTGDTLAVNGGMAIR